MNVRRTLPILLLLFVASCSPRPKVKTLDDHKFARVYAILTKKAVSVHSPGVDTSAARRTADSILLASGVTGEEMIAATQRINETPAEWRSVMNDVSAAMRDTSIH